MKLGALRGPPTTLSGDQLIATGAQRSNDYRLNYTALGN